MKPLEDAYSLVKQNKSIKIQLKENVHRYKQSLSNYSDIQTTHLNLLRRAKKKLQDYKHNYSDGSRFFRAEAENFSEVRYSTNLITII